MREQLLSALYSHAEGHIAKHIANVEVYFANPVGIGEHSNIIEAIEDELAEKIYLRSEQLELFEEYLPDILKSDLLTEEEHEELLEDEEY